MLPPGQARQRDLPILWPDSNSSPFAFVPLLNWKSGAHLNIWMAWTIETIWVRQVILGQILPQRGMVWCQQESGHGDIPREDTGQGCCGRSAGAATESEQKCWENRFCLAYFRFPLGSGGGASFALILCLWREPQTKSVSFPKATF